MIDVTAAIIKKDEKYLIAKRRLGKSLGGKWEFPGGKLEDGETPENCLERELKEEFGITTKVGDLLATNVHDYGNFKIRLAGYITQYIISLCYFGMQFPKQGSPH